MIWVRCSVLATFTYVSNSARTTTSTSSCTDTTTTSDKIGDWFIGGDHRDTPSVHGAMVSGRRTAEVVVKDLR